MEESGGQDPVAKSRVLNVRPLRCLVPIFPSTPSFTSFPHTQAAAPFVCASPSGPFPSGFAPFYPFSAYSDAQNMQTPPFGFSGTIPAPVPINSFRTAANGDAGSSRRSSRGRGPSQSEEDGYSDSIHATDAEDSSKVASATTKKKTQKSSWASSSQDIDAAYSDVDIDAMVDKILESFNLIDFDTFRRADGDKQSVGYIRLIYEVLRRKISQIEDSKESTPGVTRRPDLRAGTILMNKGIRTNIRKRIGVVPGVEVGDIFFFRMEMCLIGLHAPIMAGIDYMGLKVSQDEEPVAVSIVSSGGYEDNSEYGDVLIYSGQGGNVYKRGMEITDQKLERGNLALEKSLHRGNEVRVIRGVKDVATLTGKIYVYDGLYKIQESWVEKGKSGCNVFKYKLVRLSGQPEAFNVWKSVQQWKDGSADRVGVILPDLTSGAESISVSLVNDVDDEKGPAYFTYSPHLKYSKPVNSTESSTGCSCHGGCLAGNSNCPCIQRNGVHLPYVANGVLVSQKALIHECGSSCKCPSNCKNRVSQSGLRVRLEVFKTKDKGWGLRSWDPIRSGAFICEYAGEVIDISRAEEFGGENNDDYIFSATRTNLPGEAMLGVSNETPKIPFPLIISAKDAGNVARFMNHSCSPNVFWQPVLRENSKECDLHIVFYAIRHIPPMTELTYGYGIVPPDTAHQRKKKCLCGSAKCVGYFY
ncbi:histone-lysine N-methyltransferase, H3 lysine-9 specific SUVH1-like [Durio zibethinus]|uniref:Histone-lysine N-methyltransferase, H3 lysine-9 specific SUVH1-like n=1 Tax=Durio zibethinus TaxID=66656 RepID=A0A6P6AP23_DURZI|nr:histone-lysine N-methyltransferase, H3 lysine-9 specific SUVH1-like [Durio zibethinus]XP_022766569.1 histone-lysine N-methyltransferase, H3 lysine-9 specific SUVH1-like [Durio zibethinus]XP_022766570.1 histone-lysine N-methyltransferase, H3 lysine-9 specific SUVH1-like [Durio zibethinus]XP_022766571.1 histone-lysine N-methyltransferase, H3 lysine-9 specific SUVH1-like [Durio zibethinus]